MSRDLLREVIAKKAQEFQGNVGTHSGVGGTFIWIAGPFDEDMHGGDMDNIHAEVANLLELIGSTPPVFAKLIVLDLNECDVIGVDEKEFDDCHATLTVGMHGFEHTLAVLFVNFADNALPGTASNGNNESSFPFVATIYGRNKHDVNLSPATYRNEEMLFFRLGLIP